MRTKKKSRNLPKSRASASAAPHQQRLLAFPRTQVLPEWNHPFLRKGYVAENGPLSRIELQQFAYDFYERFLPYFTNQEAGSLESPVTIELTNRMRQKLGLAYLFEHKIRLNESYFASDPSLLPYTLFHELTHLWLYDCLLDPGHTRRFYNKMAEFESIGLPIDPDVHIHTRVAPEGRFVYSCPNCKNRWYLRGRLTHSIYCGHCFDRDGVEYYAKRLRISVRTSMGSDPGSAA